VAVSDEASARAIGEALLEEVGTSVAGEIVTTGVREFPTCWVVGYQSRVYLETGAFSFALVGGPIIVNRRTGTARFGASSLPAEDQLDPE